MSAWGKALKVDSFALESLHVEGSYCQFNSEHNTFLASDWDRKFWMKIDGEMVEFQSRRSDPEVEAQVKSKHWRETLMAGGVTVSLDLTETGRGDDTAAFRGHIDVLRGTTRVRLWVAGGCGA